MAQTTKGAPKQEEPEAGESVSFRLINNSAYLIWVCLYRTGSLIWLLDFWDHQDGKHQSCLS